MADENGAAPQQEVLDLQEQAPLNLASEQAAVQEPVMPIPSAPDIVFQGVSPQSQIDPVAASSVQVNEVTELVVAEKVSISQEAQNSIRDFVELFEEAIEIPVEGIKSTYNVQVSLDRDHEISEAINNLNSHESISHQELVDVFKGYNVHLSDKYPDPAQPEPIAARSEQVNELGSVESINVPENLDVSANPGSESSPSSPGDDVKIQEPNQGQDKGGANVEDVALAGATAAAVNSESSPDLESIIEEIRLKLAEEKAPGLDDDRLKEVVTEAMSGGKPSNSYSPMAINAGNDVLGVGKTTEKIVDAAMSLGVEGVKGVKAGSEKISKGFENLKTGSTAAFEETRTQFSGDMAESQRSAPIMSSFNNEALGRMTDIRSRVSENIEAIKSGFDKDGTQLSQSQIDTVIAKTEDMVSDYIANGATVAESIGGMDQEQKETALKELKDGADLMAEIGKDESLQGQGGLKDKADKLAESLKNLMDVVAKMFKRENEQGGPSLRI